MRETRALKGLVVDRSSSEPLRGLEIEVLDLSSGERRCLGAARTTRAGRFTVRLDPPRTKRATTQSILVEVRKRGGALLATSRADLPAEPRRVPSFHIAVLDGLLRVHEPELVRVAGEPVNREAATRLSIDDLVELRRRIEGRTRAIRNPEAVARAFPYLEERLAARGDCGTGAAEFVRRLLSERVAKESPVFYAYSLTGAARWFYTQDVAVKYTTDATFDRTPTPFPTEASSVPFTNGPSLGTYSLTTDVTGAAAPIYAQKVGLCAQYALTRYLNPPFSLRDPRSGAPPRVEIWILRLDAGRSGQTEPAWNHIEIANDLASIQEIFSAVSHELFHRIQYQYNAAPPPTGLDFGWSLREGGARFAEDCVWDHPNRYASWALSQLANPSASLLSGDASGGAYSAGLFWKYVAEQHSSAVTAGDEPAIGIDAHRRVLEQTATALGSDPGLGYTADALRAARARMPFYGSLDRFAYYDGAFVELGTHETTWGNYLLAKLLHRAGAQGRFAFKEDGEPITASQGGADWASTAASWGPFQQAKVSLTLAQGSSLPQQVITGQQPWTARCYEILPSASSPPRDLQVIFAADASMSDPLVQIVRFRNGALDDIHRSDRPSYTKTVSMEGLSSVVVIVSCREHAGPGATYTLDLREIPPASDAMITRWNTMEGKEYEVDPVHWSWTWISPDVMVDNDGDGLADTAVFFDQNNKLKVRLRNRGKAAAAGIGIRFWYQKATPYLSSSAWQEVRNQANTIQQVTGETLALAGSAGDTKWFAVDWCPLDDGTGHPHWCIKVVVSSSSDINTDDKVALSNFAHVVHAAPKASSPSSPAKEPPKPGDKAPEASALLLRLPEADAHHAIAAIPRGPTWTLAVDLPEALRPRAGHPAARRGSPQGPALAPPDAAVLGSFEIRRATAHRLADDTRDGRRPEEERHHPVDPATLPPGVDPSKLVTLAHFVDGVVVGGITYTIRDEESAPEPPPTPCDRA